MGDFWTRGWAGAVLGVLLLSTVGCSGISSTSTVPGQSPPVAQPTTTRSTVLTTTTMRATTTTQATTTTALRPSVIPWGEVGTYTNSETGAMWDVILYAPEDFPDGSYMEDAAANRVVGILAEIRVTGNVPVEVNPTMVSIQDSDNFVYTYGYFGGSNKQELGMMTVNPGQVVKGYVLFAVPEAATVQAGLYDPSYGLGNNSLLIWGDAQ